MSNFVLISDLIILYHFPAGIATSWRGNFWMAQVAGGWAGLAGGGGGCLLGFRLAGRWLAGVAGSAGFGWRGWLLGLASAGGGGGCLLGFRLAGRWLAGLAGRLAGFGWRGWLAGLAGRLAGFGSGICLSSLACLLRLGAWPALVWGVWLGCCRRDLSRCWFRLAA